MKALLLSLAIFTGLIPALAAEHTLEQAGSDAANVQTLVLNGNSSEAMRLMQLAPQLVNLQSVIIDGITSDETAAELVSAVAACSGARSIRFRNCALSTLPSNLRMLTQITAFTSENTSVADGEQFYNAIADMPNVMNVTVSGTDFRTLPQSFSRLRVMENIQLVNTDLQLASGYDRNHKTTDELRVTQNVQFGFGNDALNLSYTCYNAEAGKSHVQMFRDVLQGAWRASNEFYAPASAMPFSKPHPLVKPPVAGMDIYPDVYTFNSLTGSVLEYGSGTSISVPAMAFVDANGNEVQGNVDITYREFRDVVDVVLSGIPMKYDSGGVVGDFESAGMFEMQASQNGSEVFLKADKEISLKFAVTDTASDYNFYRLDEQNGWTYLENTGAPERDQQSGVPATTRSPEAVMPSVSKLDGLDTAGLTKRSSTAAVNLYCNAVRNIRVRDWIRDTTDFDARYNDTCYYGMSRAIVANSSLRAEEKRKRSSRVYLRHRMSGDNYTVLSIHNAEGRYGYNYELGAYAGYSWKVNEKMTRREVSERFGKDAGINDCRILKEGDNHFLELKYYWGYEQVSVEPVRIKGGDSLVAPAEKQKESLYAAYTKKLNSRRGQTNRDNGRQVVRQQRRVERAHSDSLRAWNGLKRVMNENEKSMDFTAWKTYVNGEAPFADIFSLPMVVSETRALYQMVRIPTFGIFNFDRVIRGTKPVLFVTKVVVAAGSVIVPAVIYVIDKLRNRMLSYSGGAVGGVRGTYDATGMNYLLVTDKEGNLYRVSEEQFMASTESASGNELEFEATQLPSDGSTAESVRNAAGANR